MSERTIYDGMDLHTAMQEKLAELEKAHNDMMSSGFAKATAERDYKMILNKYEMLLKAQGYSASAIDKLIYGVDEVAHARYQRDVAEVVYDVTKERINCTKLEIRILENQISREYGKYGVI